MNSFSLFTDVSLNPKLKLGVGAYLIIPTSYLENFSQSFEKSELAEGLVMQRFEDTTSTKLEVQTVLWALEDFRNKSKVSGPSKLQVYTDSQCVAGLLRRRPRLEAGAFLCKGTGHPLKNAPLYRTFYELYDEMGFEVIKVTGHSPSSSHDTVHHIFSLVDRKVRQALKLWMAELM